MQPKFYTSFITRNRDCITNHFFPDVNSLILTPAWGGTDKMVKSKRKNKNIQHNTIILTMISWSLASHRPTYTPVLAGLELWLNREDIFFFFFLLKKEKKMNCYSPKIMNPVPSSLCWSLQLMMSRQCCK